MKLYVGSYNRYYVNLIMYLNAIKLKQIHLNLFNYIKRVILHLLNVVRYKAIPPVFFMLGRGSDKSGVAIPSTDELKKSSLVGV